MDPHPRAIRERGHEPDEDPIAGDDRWIVGQDQAAMELPGLDTGEVERGPTRSRCLDRRSVDLDLANADGPVARHEPERRAAGQPGAAERAGHDDPATLDREDPVDRQARTGGWRG